MNAAPQTAPIRVNGTPIDAAAIAAEAQNHHAPKGKPGQPWRAAARALIVRELLLQEARNNGLSAEPATLGPDLRETDDEALIRALLEQNLDIQPPDEAAIRAAWAKDPQRFTSPQHWEAAHILCAADAANDEAQQHAQLRAQALAETLQKDPKAFTRLAAQSDCGSKNAGGALGQIGPGDTVAEFEAALSALEPGMITQTPVRTRYGYHIIRLDAHAQGRVLPYENVRAQIGEALEKAAWVSAAQHYTQQLIGAATIEGIDLN